MSTQFNTEQTLVAEIAELRDRLEEAEDRLRVILKGESDLIGLENSEQSQVYNLQNRIPLSNLSAGDILRQINDVVIAIDLDQRVTFFNAAAERLYGVHACDVFGRQIDEIYTRHWPNAEAEAAVWEALREQGEWRGEAVHRRFDGREFQVEANVSTLRSQDGNASGFLAVIRDLTEHKQNERLLKENQRRYSGIIKSAMDAVICIDDQHKIILFNPAAEDMFRCVAAEAIGESLERFIPERTRDAHGTQIKAFDWIIGLSSRKMGSFGVISGLRGNGEEFPIEVSISQDEIEGKKTYTAILRDISERVNADIILKKQIRLEDQLNKVAASVPGLMCSFRLGPDGSASMPYASPAFESIYGLPHEVVAEDFSPVFTRIHPDDSGHVNETIAVSANTLQPWHDVFRYKHPSKGEIWVEGHSMPQRESDGSIVWHGYIHDVTDRKQREIELQERTARYELVLNGAQDAIWDWDVQNKRVHYSSRWKVLRGFADNEVSDAEEEWSASVHPDDKSRVLTAIESHFEGKTPFFCEEYRIRCKDGTWKWILDRGIAQKDSSGKVVRMAGSESDITDRKLVETSLQERETELRLIMDATPALISYLDTDFRYLRANKTYENWFCLHQEQIIGYTAQEIIGEKAWGIVSPYLERARSGERVSFDYQIPYGTGKPRWVHGNYIPNKNEDGSVKGIVVHVVDIDDRKQAELERQKFVSLADNSQEFIGMCDMNFMPFYVNAAGMRLVGLKSLEQALRTPVQEFFFPEDQHFIIEEFFPRIIRERRGQVEIRFRHFQTGTALWMVYNVFFITNDQGEPVGLATVSQDITARKLAELALLESERKNRFLADILEHADQPFGVGYPDGRLEYVNSAFERLTGFSRDELLTMDWATELTPPEWKAIEQAKLEELQSNQEAICYEKEYYRKDGTRVPIELLVEVVSDDAGQLIHYYAFITDLTDRKQAEAALRESEERMRLAIETTGIGIWEWNVITNQIRWDAQMFRIYGITPTQDGFVKYSTWSTAVIAEDLHYQEELLQETVRSGKTNSREFRILRSGDLEVRYIQGVETVRVNESGKVDWVVGTNLDITERKRAQDELNRTQLRLSLAIEELKAGYWEWDLTNQSLYLSPEWKRQLGFDDTELGTAWSQKDDRLHPDDYTNVVEATENFIAGRQPTFELQFRLRHKDGSYRWIHSRGALLRDKGGKPYRMLGLNLDITDFVETRAVNEHRDAMERSFRLYVATQTAAAIAHELNQPLTAISYYAYVAQNLLETGSQDPQKLAQVMEKCGQQALRAGEVIKQLLALLHKGETISEPIDVNKTVKYALTFVKASGHLDTFKIGLDLADGLPQIMANELQVQKVLVNLLINGLESIQECGTNSGTITVTTRRSPNDPSRAQVTVCDNGTGVADINTLKQMFQPFSTTKATGLGMGLAISRALVEAHGGKMWAEQNADRGISVHFTLPFML